MSEQKNQIEEIKRSVVGTIGGVVGDLWETAKTQSRGFILGFGIGVLLTGPFPGGVVIAIIGAAIIGSSIFIKK